MPKEKRSDTTAKKQGKKKNDTEGPQPGLYGITNSNRSGKQFFGKNQFNSSFPVALSCYMRDTKQKAVYLILNSSLKVDAEEASFDEVFNTKKPNNELDFQFEAVFDPYKKYSHDTITKIDLVVKDLEGNFLRPLEVKLTVLPDNTTVKNKDESKWASELVIRPASTLYCAIGMFDSCIDKADRILEIFEPVCRPIRDWSSPTEIKANMPKLLDALNMFQQEFQDRQKPFLLQPIWKTVGLSPALAENAFDVFVWSDFALCRTFLDRSLNARIASPSKRGKKDEEEVNRYMRCSARLARILYELANSVKRKANTEAIYTEMAFGRQTDKEFALPGNATRDYMCSPRRVTPALKRDVLSKLILNGGVKRLSPERRFDQTIFFTAADLFVDEGRTDEVMETE